jgi:ceramide glucosyltransferase
MRLLEFIAAIGIVASLGYYNLSIITGLLFARRISQHKPALPKIPPRVAVLKPLQGMSKDLLGNVVSFMEVAYSRIEYIFGVSSYEDRAVDVPVGLRAPYQFATITVSIGEEPGYSNRKVAKLVRMGERASEKVEIFLISDADVSVERDHVQRVVSELLEDPKIGIVTCLYRGRPANESFAAKMESLYINTDFAPQVVLAEAIEPMHYALGATIAITKEALDAIGGFKAIGNLLADDYHLGRKVSDAGFKIRLSTSTVTVACEDSEFSNFWNHQLRWARTYRSVRPLSLAIIMTHGPFWALVYLLCTGFSPLSLLGFAAIIASRLTMAAVMVGRVLKMPDLLGDIWLLPFKDLLMTGIYFASLTGKTVLWGGRRFRLTPGGAMHELI